MIAPQFIHNVTNSFTLWADHILLSRGGAYTNITGAFTGYSDDRLPDGYSAYGCPHKEWVMNSAITGASIPSGFYVGGVFTPRSDSFALDFQNGRVIGSGLVGAITGSYSVKDFNIYNSNQDEESLIIEVCQSQSQSYNNIGSDISVPYLPPYQPKIPAIFINTETQENKPLALGGTDSSNVKFNMIIFAHEPYQLDGVLGLFADTGDEMFKELPLESAPLTQWGDIKNGYYNYTELVAASGTNNCFIDEARSSKITDSLRRGLKTELYIGMCDFIVTQYRNPRAPTY